MPYRTAPLTTAAMSLSDVDTDDIVEAIEVLHRWQKMENGGRLRCEAEVLRRQRGLVVNS